jgi:uncharacterized membrane protein (DUF2068 family)
MTSAPAAVTTAEPARPRRDPIFLVAAFKLLHAVLLLALALGVHHLLRKDVAETVRRWAMALRADPHDRIVETIVGHVGGLSQKRMEAIALALFVYAAMFLVEGIGLLLRRRWAEWMTVATTALLLPLETHEVMRRPGPVRIAVLVANVLIVVYLIVRLRRRRSNRAVDNP